MAEKRSRAERRQNTVRAVDHLKSSMLSAGLEALTEMEQQKPELEPWELLEYAFKAMRAEAESIFKTIKPQDRHLARRAAVEVKLDLRKAARERRVEKAKAAATEGA